jgi:hypothetical protein
MVEVIGLIVPFAARNHTASTPALHGASRMSISV